MKKLIAITTLATLFLASGTALAGGGGHHGGKHDSQFIIYFNIPAPVTHYVRPHYQPPKRIVHKKKYNRSHRHVDRSRHYNKARKHNYRHH
ncbi:MAG: hypothetical protein R3F02_11220 [Thiolinea sp.]